MIDKWKPGTVTVVRNENTLNDEFWEEKEAGKKKKEEKKKEADEPPVNRLCPHCGKSFINSAKLEYHINWHNGVFPFKCDHCDFKSHSFFLLRVHKCPKQNNEPKCELCPEPMSKQHLKNHHSENLPLSCKECPYRAASERTMAIHAAKYHKDKGYTRLKIQCPKCPAMITEGKVKGHDARYHDEKLPFGCDQCQYRGVSKASIVQHVGLHHSKAAHRFLCEGGCGKSFTQSCAMRHHMRRYCVNSTVKDQMVQREIETGKAEERKMQRKRQKEERDLLYAGYGINN